MTTFTGPTLLPHYDKREIESMKTADGYKYFRRYWDGRFNKIEIQPMIKDPGQKLSSGVL